MTTLKQKVALFLGLLLLLYVYLFLGEHSTALMHHIKVLTSLGEGDIEVGDSGGDHRLGQIVTHHNGSFLYFHLPSLTDFNIERDFYRFKPSSSSTNAKEKFCLRVGTDEVIQKTGEEPVCVCKDNYSGPECALPPLVHQTASSSSSAKGSTQFARLLRPRRILVSLIWPTYPFEVANSTSSKRARLERLAEAMTAMAAYVDLFVLHELRIELEMSPSNGTKTEEEKTEQTEDPNSLAYQMTKGRLLGRHSAYSLLFSSRVTVPPSSTKKEGEQIFELTDLEAAAALKSWSVFARQITEYRPADLLLFMSAGNLPSEPLLRFLKYHSGLNDITHLLPLYSLKLLYGTGQTSSSAAAFSSATVEVDHKATESRLNGFLKRTDSDEQVPLTSASYHLRNVMLSFELMTFLCRYEVEHFLASYCLTEQRLVDRFQRHFWPIRLGGVGSAHSANLSATFSIPP